MTIENTSFSVTFNGTGSTGPFDFTFKFFVNSDILVNKTVGGVVSLLALGTDYTLTGAGADTGGSVTLVSVLNTGETLTISRYVPLVQETKFSNYGAFFSKAHEDAFDRVTMQIQQLGGSVYITAAGGEVIRPIVTGSGTAEDPYNIVWEVIA